MRRLLLPVAALGVLAAAPPPLEPRVQPRQVCTPPALAVVTCTVGKGGDYENCAVTEESTPGMGYGQAALRMAKARKAPPTGPDGASVIGKRVRVPVGFRAVSPVPLEPVMPISVEDRNAAYPAGATRDGVQGEVVLTCDVSAADNGLEACRVARETPAGYGFGDAALAFAPRHRACPEAVDAPSGTITFRARFSIDGPFHYLTFRAGAADPPD